MCIRDRLRIVMWETTQSDMAWAEYDKDRDAWLEEKGVDVDAFYEGTLSFEIGRAHV